MGEQINRNQRFGYVRVVNMLVHPDRLCFSGPWEAGPISSRLSSITATAQLLGDCDSSEQNRMSVGIESLPTAVNPTPTSVAQETGSAALSHLSMV